MEGTSCQPGVQIIYKLCIEVTCWIELGEIKQFVHFTHFMDNVVFVSCAINQSVS